MISRIINKHPSIHFLSLNPSVGSRGGWSLSQQSSGDIINKHESENKEHNSIINQDGYFKVSHKWFKWITHFVWNQRNSRSPRWNLKKLRGRLWVIFIISHLFLSYYNILLSTVYGYKYNFKSSHKQKAYPPLFLNLTFIENTVQTICSCSYICRKLLSALGNKYTLPLWREYSLYHDCDMFLKNWRATHVCFSLKELLNKHFQHMACSCHLNYLNNFDNSQYILNYSEFYRRLSENHPNIERNVQLYNL